MQWDSRRNNKRACWWEKGGPYWSHFFSSQGYRLEKKDGGFHLGLLFCFCHWTHRIAVHSEFDAPCTGMEEPPDLLQEGEEQKTAREKRLYYIYKFILLSHLFHLLCRSCGASEMQNAQKWITEMLTFEIE